MEFKKISSKFIKSLLPALKDVSAYSSVKDNERFNKTLDGMLLLLYREIHNGEKHFEKAAIQEPVLQTDIVNPNLSGGSFFPENIKSYIQENIKYQLVYRLNINGKIKRIYFAYAPISLHLNSFE